MTRKLYGWLLAACVAGYVWLIYNFYQQHNRPATDVCLIKRITGYACPSCGTTRSVMALFGGDFYAAFFINPFGFLVAGIMLMAPLWIVYDLVLKKDSLLQAYHRCEKWMVRPLPAVLLITLVVANWIWNIKKGL
ncbi:MAG: DUF2752 domain-containing protein [Chitinophagales bacterium]